MTKFVKELIEKKRAITNALKVKSVMKGKQGLYTFYSIWFSTIKSYATGKPSSVMKASWKLYVVPFVPSDWVCTDKGFVGVKAKRRCKLINHGLNKTGKISLKDHKWLENELLIAFQKDFSDKNLDFDKLVEMPEDKIDLKLKKFNKENKGMVK